MATVVTFHAHPDDEAIATGGTMARLASEGHRVVLVTATRGENGEVPDGLLRPGEQLWERRVQELEEAASILGVARLELLGYEDSGMMGTAENESPGCFWSADLEEAAGRLARILEQERPDVLTIYDPHGSYGHPDHIKVHRVGARASELVRVPKVYEATVNRDHIRSLMSETRSASELPDFPDTPGVDETMGMPAEVITTTVDVSGLLDVKRRAMAAHASQIAETSFFLRLPPDAFARAFGKEWFILRGAPSTAVESHLLDGVPG